MPQFVKLVNEGPNDFRFYDGPNERRVKPGTDAFVSWRVAASNLGDPTLMNVGKDTRRSDALASLKHFHGFQMGIMSDDQWEQNRPHVQVWDQETGNRIFMLLEDEDGLQQNEFAQGDGSGSEMEVLQRQVAILTQQIAQMAEAKNAGAAPVSAGNGSFVGVDAPPADPLIVDGDDEMDADALDGGVLNVGSSAPVPTASEDVPTSTPTLAPKPR